MWGGKVSSWLERPLTSFHERRASGRLWESFKQKDNEMIKKILMATAIAGVMALGSNAIMVDTASAKEIKGKVTKTAKEGRVITIGGEKFNISGSRTDVFIGGKGDQDRADIKVGMSCTADVAKRKGKVEAKTVKCKK